MEKTLSVASLRKVIREANEAKNEFKPVYGKDVVSKNKTINADAYKEIEKATKNYDGGVKAPNKEAGAVTPANNRGMSDLEYDSISKPFKDKVKSQLKGYTSKEAEEMHKDEPFGNATFNDNEEILKHAREAKKEHDKTKTDGLVGSKYKKETEDLTQTIGESKKISRIKFKRTEFLSEGHMLSKVPDEYKVKNRRFVMEDSCGNKYIVEWNDEKPIVDKCLNERLVSEEINKIKSLYNYRSKDYFVKTTPVSRVNEGKDEFSNMLNRARQLMK